MARHSLGLKLAFLLTCIGIRPALGQALAVPIPNPPDPLLQGLNITNDAAAVGMWSPSQSWPLVSIHIAVLPDGSVITYGSPLGQGVQDGRTFVRWNPFTGEQTTSPNSTGVNSFCSAGVLQPDSGGLLVSGGNEQFASTVFDYLSDNANTVSSQLASDRWYATMTMLPDGRTLITGGSFPYSTEAYANPSGNLGNVSMTPEVYTPGSGWSSLFGADSRDAFGPDFNRWWYPRQWVAPDGNLFGISSEKWWRLDPDGNGSIIAVGNFKTGVNNSTRPNIGPTCTAVMYDVGKILQVGGNGYTNGYASNSSERATVFDITGGNPIVTDVSSMNWRRQWANTIVVPTGDVIVTGGTQFADNGGGDAVFQAELWDPDTGNWTGLASASIIRNYHSTTVLLPNGTIFSSGGGVPGPVTNFNYEIFYPPYLFQAASGADVLADQPQMVSIDDTRFGYGSSFQVEMDDARTVSRVAVIGLSSTTHSFNMGQRYYPASFAQVGNMLTVDAPENANLAPPGFYLLYAVDSAGVPSRGFIISLGEAACNVDGDCDDGNACTADQCNGGLCSNTNTCTDPLASYPFETGAEDATGNGNDGSLQGGASIVSGQVGNAVDIDGGSEFVDLPSSLVEPCDDFTYAAWVRLDTNQVWGRIFDFGNDTNTNMFLTPAAGDVNTLRFALKVPSNNGGAEEQISFPFTFPTGVWTHVAVVLEGNTGRLYVDGAEVATATVTGNPSDMGNTVNNWLGQSQWPDPNLDGRLDEVKMSCRAYSAQEISNLAASVECTTGAQCDDGNPCTANVCSDGVCSNPDNQTCFPQDPVAVYPMDDGGGTTASDLSGNGYDATLVNGASFTGAGQIGGAVDINGGTQFVDLPDGLLGQCTDFTFAAWVELDTVGDWSRIFDFGDDTVTNMFLTPKVGGADTLRFALKVPGNNGGAEEQISFPFVFPTGIWTHVAVVLDGDTGTLFVNGTPAASGTITGNPADMGSTVNNWLGESQYTADPTLDGRLDDIWISCRAYSDQEISDLATVGPACNDGTCNPGEDCSTCPQDCGSCCGNNVCGDPGEDCSTCPSDCGACCGNSVCGDPGESCSTCPSDCGACCGNSVCGDPGEDCSTCPQDCGVCPPACDDGACDAGETCSGCPEDCGMCAGVLINSDFESGAEGFTYSDDTFRGTTEPAYASGSIAGGMAQVNLGGINEDDITGMSGGYTQAFTLSASAAVNFEFAYTLDAHVDYEPNECSEVLVSVDGTLYGSGSDDFVVQICDGGALSGTFNATTPALSAGVHTITIGGYNSAKTQTTEETIVQVDDVLVVEVATGPSCSDGIQNQDETDVDCGGSVCLSCPIGASCAGNGDCQSGYCAAGICTQPICGDGVVNQAGEKCDTGGNTATCDSDCTLPVCPDGLLNTAADEECDDGNIVDDDFCSNSCVAATCSDTVANGDETDVDCGGGGCPTCTLGQACLVNGDCTSGACIGNACVVPPPTCSDGIQNQDETDVDCGGSACLSCPNGDSCAGDGDCQSGYCAAGNCAQPTCGDGVVNQGETDIDCGGPNCSPCQDGAGCGDDKDCESGVCSGNVCQVPSCGDSTQNGNETGVDCGGSCPPCITSNAFIEQGGQVVMEVENFHQNTPQGTHSWAPGSAAGASGGSFLTASPNNGSFNVTGYIDSSPRLDFEVDFQTTGTYFVWVRGFGATGSDDSCHAGLDGGPGRDAADTTDTSDQIDLAEGSSFSWSNSTMDGPAATFFVDTVGVHTVNIWMREDGAQLDKILLTTDSGIVPSGTGPAQSPGGPPICADGVLNQDESDIDCGGSVCGGCPGGAGCFMNGDCLSGVCTSNVCEGPLVSASFDAGADGFNYADDTFRGTSQPTYANGSFSTGALQVTLGGINDDDIVNMSGGWSTSFDLSQPAALDVTVGYSITAATAYEPGECSQVLVSLDGGLLGAGGNDYVVQICDGGSQSGVFTTTTPLVGTGSHTITVGAFNNAKTELAEVTTVQIDQIQVALAPPDCSADADCDDADPCTADLCGGGFCTNPDNGSCVADAVAIYPMDDGSGAIAADISGNANDAALMNGASFTGTGQIGGAVDINGGTEFVDLPDGLVSQCDDFTFAAWVWLDANGDWNRIFDFGTDTATNMFLTPKVGGSDTLRFALKVPGINGGAEEQISFPFAFPLSTWTHVAVVLDGNSGTLFIDGAPVASATVSGNPADMGSTVNNWLGESQYTADPTFDGQLDEVHISCRAFTDQEVNDLASLDAQAFNRRSLLETTEATVSQFNLEETLDALGTNAGLPANGALLYQQLIDSYATAPGNLASAVHCGDENPGGAHTLNGYPIQCDRLEAQQFSNLGSWFATGVVNRIDLAPDDGAHCGNQRLVFANSKAIGNGRMLMIIEAQLPNPTPSTGLAGCLPIAQFWRSLEAVDDPIQRGALLKDAFLASGVPGFGPFMSADHLMAGSGQIRTNNFNDEKWTMREFKLLDDGTQASVIPAPVGDSPHGALWNDTSGLVAGPACRANFLNALGGLLTDDPAAMTFNVDDSCKDSESLNDFTAENYPLHLLQGDPAGFQAELDLALQGTGLTPLDIAARARFAGSCIGCHQETRGSTLGNGVQAPFSLGFVHVEERFLEECEDGPCFPISQALREVFLPHREQVMSQLLGD